MATYTGTNGDDETLCGDQTVAIESSLFRAFAQ